MSETAPTPYCPSCQSPLEVLKACGAVQYFCPSCQGLVSKHSVSWQSDPPTSTTEPNAT